MADVKSTQLRPWAQSQRLDPTSLGGWGGPAGSPRPGGADVLLNRYRIMDTRGTGGFGTVLACWDTRLQRRVAIKRLPLAQAGAPVDSASTLREALTEARTSSMLAHPNIVTVYDFEVEGPIAYLVMEYVDGITLAELLARVEGGALTCDECAYLVESLGSALAYAHAQGVLHLDIKPTNIMFDTAGTVKLCDFGMATLASAAGYGGARGGTIGYMPPEQIEGGFVDERTDIYSLAIVAWQALAGQPSFASGRSAEESFALEQRGAPSLAKMGVAIPEAAEATLLCALEPQIAQRPVSVEAFSVQLAAELGSTQVGAQSILHLMSQADDPYEDEIEDWEGERLPLAVQFPHLESAVARVLSAGLVLACLWSIVASLPELHFDKARLGMALAALVTALWTPLGSLAVGAATCARLFAGPRDLVPLSIVLLMAVTLLVWWLLVGLHSRWSTTAVLAPLCLASPLASPAVSIAVFSPGAAMATSGLGWLAGNAWRLLLSQGFQLVEAAQQVPAPSVGTAVSLGGCMLAGLVGSAIAHARPGTGHAVFGQIVGALLLCGSQLVALRMENGGIWPQPTWENTGIGVVLCVAVCIACACHGPQDEYPGGSVI